VLAAIAAVIATSIAVSTTHFYQPCDEEDAIAAEHQVFLQGTGVEGTDEYTPRDADNSTIQQGLPLVRLLNAPYAESAASGQGESPTWVPDARAEMGNSNGSSGVASIGVENWKTERKRIVVESARGGCVVVRLMDYPAWQVRRNGVLVGVCTRPHREDGLMVIPVAAGHTTIDVSWSETRDVWIGRALSLMGLCVLGGLVLSRRKRPM
jgi:hypothetical protein